MLESTKWSLRSFRSRKTVRVFDSSLFILTHKSTCADIPCSDLFKRGAMADTVQRTLEQMIPELEDLQIAGVFTKVKYCKKYCINLGYFCRANNQFIWTT